LHLLKNIIFFYEKKIFLHLSKIFYLPFVFAVVDVVAVVVVVVVVVVLVVVVVVGVVVVGLLSISQKTPAKPSSQKHWVFIKLSA
jgi:type III secretory pathway component EscU